MNLEKQLSIAKIKLARMPDTAFMFNLLCQLETVWDRNIPYGATDGLRLYLNPDIINELSEDELIFLLAHETLHCAYLHMARINNRDHQKWNIACDYVINLFLDDRNFSMIQGILLDEQYRDMSAEQIYDMLPDNTQPDPLGQDIIENLNTQEQQQIQQNILSASMQAELQGKSDSIPDDIKRYLEQLTQPKVNWKAVLKRFLNQISKDDYSWRKPNRRMLCRGIYVPSLYSHTVGKITFAIDVSGSISQKEFNEFISEVYSCFDVCKPKDIDIIQWSHYLVAHDTVNSIDELRRIQLKGTGGTNPDIAITTFNKTDSRALIILTDGQFSPNILPCVKPVIWVVFNNPRWAAPYGQTIRV